MRIRCTTLFDITKTGAGRKILSNVDDVQQYNKSRNQQINYETILQIIGMRCQPENISTPQILQIDAKDSIWGSKYSRKNLTAWTFTFDVHYREVFNDGSDRLGNLYSDSDGVPMITRLDETHQHSSLINTFGDLKNIHYEIIEDDSNN